MSVRRSLLLAFSVIGLSGGGLAQHHAGADCFQCHTTFRAAGTVFTDSTAAATATGIRIQFTAADGGVTLLDPTNNDGNLASPLVDDGSYHIAVGAISSRTWHEIPSQGSCNTCHILGGNGSDIRTRRLPLAHTELPPGNDCTDCHHFPATQSYTQLMTPGVLNTASAPIPAPGSQVEMAGQTFPFDPTDYTITTVRPDIFAPGYFSMFDVILAVAQRNGMAVEYTYDSLCATHWITQLDTVQATDFWYHWSYDAGTGSSTEIQNRRANRWDETLWRPGVWIRVVRGEDMAGIRAEYLEEIQRERLHGHSIPNVRFAINPSDYQGNPEGSGRVTVSRQFTNLTITPHNYRAAGYPSPYSKLFQPGVVTSLDIPLTLMDQGQINIVTSVFYSHFADHYIDGYYVVELGFPGIGTAHASGRQGFVYTTENGSFNSLPNNANQLFHMTSDIAVMHAPDFSYWRWAELGNPYYESQDPTGVDPQIDEDYAAIPRGFNLHPPYPNPFNDVLYIRYNIFQPGYVKIAVFNTLGQQVTVLVDDKIENLGIHELSWNARSLASGDYYVVMRHGAQTQVRTIQYVR